MKPFDLDLALAGHPLCTRNGKEVVEFYCFKNISPIEDEPVFAAIKDENGDIEILQFSLNGS